MKVIIKDNEKFRYLGVKNVVTFDKGATYKFNMVLREGTIYGCSLRQNENVWFVTMPSVKTDTGYYQFIKMWINESLTQKIVDDVLKGVNYSDDVEPVKVESITISNKYLKNGIVKFDLSINGITFKSLTCRKVKDVNSELVDATKIAILPPSKKNKEGKYFPFYRLNLSEEDLNEIIESVK